MIPIVVAAAFAKPRFAVGDLDIYRVGIVIVTADGVTVSLTYITRIIHVGIVVFVTAVWILMTARARVVVASPWFIVSVPILMTSTRALVPILAIVILTTPAPIVIPILAIVILTTPAPIVIAILAVLILITPIAIIVPILAIPILVTPAVVPVPIFAIPILMTSTAIIIPILTIPIPAPILLRQSRPYGYVQQTSWIRAGAQSQ